MASTTSSTLKLVIEKGPRKGETLEFNPRSMVRIGRVVRGNNLPIKDSGISSKHLSIEFNSDSGKWVITDLESSNGTYLNSSLIKPLSAFELRNGDDVKIGELTSIRVEIVGNSEEISFRRNHRRQAAPKSGDLDLGVKVEVGDEEGKNLGEGGSVRVRDLKGQVVGKGVDNELEARQEKRRGGRGRGRPKKVSDVEDGNTENDGGLQVSENVANVKPNLGLGMGTRRTRSSKREENLVLPEVLSARRTRSAKNEENVMVSSVLEKVPESETLNGDDCKKVETVVLVEDKKKRAGRGRKKLVDAGCSDDAPDVSLEDTMNKEVLDVEVLNMGVRPCEEPVDDTSQQNMLEERKLEVPELEVLEQAGGEVVAVEKLSEPTMAGTQQNMVEKTDREVLQQEVPEPAGGTLGAEEQPRIEPRRETGERNETVMSASHFELEACDGLKGDVVIVEGEVDGSEKSESSKGLCVDTDCEERNQEAGDVPDLEKMTLGEWFDYLEVHLPKQIHNVTDEIIADMRKKAKQFDEFMLQQRNKDKLPVVA